MRSISGSLKRELGNITKKRNKLGNAMIKLKTQLSLETLLITRKHHDQFRNKTIHLETSLLILNRFLFPK